MNASIRTTASVDSSAVRGFVSRLSALSDRDFEQRLAGAFEDSGYSVDRDTGDAQVDLMLQVADQLWFVQTKHWRSPSIDVEPVAEFMEVVRRNEATGGIVVCAGGFSEAARLKVRGSGVRLLNGVELSGMLSEFNMAGKEACPRCGSSLIERLTEGASRRFRGCSSYPVCHYTQGAAA